MNKQEAIAFIRHRSWLSATPADFQDRLLAACDLLTFEAGSVAFRAGDDSGSTLGIVEGRAELHIALQGNDPTLGYICGPGYWSAAVVGQRRRLTMIAGPAGCQVLRLSRAEMFRITQRDPSAWRYFAELLAQNIVNAFNVIDALKRSDPVERLAVTLCNLLESLSETQGAINASQSDLGSLTQLGRSSVNAALSELENRGLIRRRYASVEIPSVSALREFICRA
jgi:CRP/FNR family transcriptional regulator, cyclic AMP receptor protein